MKTTEKFLDPNTPEGKKIIRDLTAKLQATTIATGPIPLSPGAMDIWRKEWRQRMALANKGEYDAGTVAALKKLGLPKGSI